MKRIPASLLLTAILMAFLSLDMAAKKDKKATDAPNEHLMMTSEGGHLDAPALHKFVIDGHVNIDIPDSCYNIYITDIDKEITSDDLVACVPVKDKRFRFETDLSTIKAGRIRAIMPGDNLCSAWINLYFIPGFTIDMTVNNGYYNISNKQEYNFMTNAWLNKDALDALLDSRGRQIPTALGNELKEVQIAIHYYQELLVTLQKQLSDMRGKPYCSQEDYKKIYKRMDGIYAKMEAIIDKYAASIKY